MFPRSLWKTFKSSSIRPSTSSQAYNPLLLYVHCFRASLLTWLTSNSECKSTKFRICRASKSQNKILAHSLLISLQQLQSNSNSFWTFWRSCSIFRAYSLRSIPLSNAWRTNSSSWKADIRSTYRFLHKQWAFRARVPVLLPSTSSNVIVLKSRSSTSSARLLCNAISLLS